MAESTTTIGTSADHLAVLDGWRGISILLVLATHLLPLGPKSWKLNEMTGPMGMALFFTLSGFLITRFLLRDSGLLNFLSRRFFRIVPLAWMTLTIITLSSSVPEGFHFPNYFFYANLPPQHLININSHFWSLCVEMQFYIGIAFAVKIFGKNALFLTIPVCIAVTFHRIYIGAEVDIVTWRRVDEILAGSILALTYEGLLGSKIKSMTSRTNAYWLIGILMLASHPFGGPFNYIRPYVAAWLVGVTLLSPPPRLRVLLSNRLLAYIAKISYALYVIHGILGSTWLGSGEKLEKYMKRPLLIATTFVLAHLSTNYFEKPFNDIGRRLGRSFSHAPIKPL